MENKSVTNSECKTRKMTAEEIEDCKRKSEFAMARDKRRKSANKR